MPRPENMPYAYHDHEIFSRVGEFVPLPSVRPVLIVKA